MKTFLVVMALSAAGWAQNVPAPDIAGNALRMNEQNNVARYQAKPQGNEPTEAVLASATLSCFTGDIASTHECHLRETARFFLIAGDREAALRILCTTIPAQEAFRAAGALTNAKWQDNVEAIRRCLAASGLSPDSAPVPK